MSDHCSEAGDFQKIVEYRVKAFKRCWKEVIDFIEENMLEFMRSDEHPDLKSAVNEVLKSLIEILSDFAQGEGPFDFDENVAVIAFYNLAAEALAICDSSLLENVTTRLVSFFKSIVPYITHLLDAYPKWIDDNYRHEDGSDFHMAHTHVMAMLQQLRDDFNALECESDHRNVLTELSELFINLFNEFLTTGLPPLELINATMVGYPEIHRFMEKFINVVDIWSELGLVMAGTSFHLPIN